MNNLIMADIALQIMDNGRICCGETFIDTQNSKEVIEVFNILLVTHRERYLHCYTEANKNNERKLLLEDYHCIFKESNISDNLIQLMFSLSVCDNYASISFRELCIDLCEQVMQCNLLEIQYVIFRKIINIIMSCQLYINEPYTSLLRETTKQISNLLANYSNFSDLKLLE